jgi:predicted dehydrogenase
MNKIVWLVGSGFMAQDYIKVLNALECKTIVIGRSQKSADAFNMATDHAAIPGGLSEFLKTNPEIPSHAIVSVSRETLSEVTCELLKYGVKNILVEKPAGLSMKEITNICELSETAEVVVGFNRRFYAPVLKAQEIIQEDGGVQSFSFEFTEWSHKLKDLVEIKGPQVMATWFLGNSVHVADLAFYLGGFPKQINSYVSGGLDWHPAGSIFSGAGKSEKGALFSYQANWESAGRWGVEILTAARRIYLRPLEELSVQKKGALAIEKIEIDQTLDLQYKPGLYLQTKNFLENKLVDFCKINELKESFPVYLKMAGYNQLL